MKSLIFVLIVSIINTIALGQSITFCNDSTPICKVPNKVIKMLQSKYPEYSLPELDEYLDINKKCIHKSYGTDKTSKNFPPFYLEADLDGNGQMDFVVVLKNKNEINRTAFIFLNNKMVLFDKVNIGKSFISYLKKGIKKVAIEGDIQKDEDVINDGFILYNDSCGDEAKYIKNNKLVSRLLSGC